MILTTLISLQSIYVAAAMIAMSSLTDRSSTSAAADSVDVLLFSTPPIATLTISDGGVRADRKSSAILNAVDEQIEYRGAISNEVIIHDADNIVLQSGKRRRSLRGDICIRARAGRLVVTARMTLDDYLPGALSAEANSVDPREYLIALQVLQRNYVRTHRARHAPLADVCDNTHCQLFHGLATSARMRSITHDASAITLKFDDTHPCYYSANCGGSSLTPVQVWGAHESGYNSVSCDECRNSRWHRWTRSIDATSRAVAALNNAPATPFIDDDFKIRVGRAIGFDAVPSNTVDRLERRGRSFRISGRGFGHRVGMCQDGARELALRGSSAKQILKKYFPSAVVSLNAATSASP